MAIEHDKSATGHMRMTCSGCGRSIVRQPWMSLEGWQRMAEAFMQHKCQASSQRAPSGHTGGE